MTAKKPSEEEIAEKRRQRAEKKEREAAKKELEEREGPNSSSSSSNGSFFSPRNWVNVKKESNVVGNDSSSSNSSSSSRVRLLSWNILAQGLVRRKLFPGSDCLKWKDREAGLRAEMVSHDWDIATFQEVDKIEIHGPSINQSERRYSYNKGYNSKQHGLIISWRVSSPKSDRLTFQEEAVGSKTIYLDQECVDSHSGKRRALSRVTRNVALFVALAYSNDITKGIIVATTHLFWHPMHAYERVRQSGILKRSLVEWKNDNPAWKDWPIILAGDFNDQPHSATYKLMTGEPMSLHNWEEIRISSVVHKSVDDMKEQEGAATGKEEGQEEEDGEGDREAEEGEEEEEDGEDDQMLKNCRLASPQDGLLSFEELIQLHDLSQARPSGSPTGATSHENGLLLVGRKAKASLISAYGSKYGFLEEDQEGNYFGSANRGRERFDDPNWTSKTPNPHLGPSRE